MKELRMFEFEVRAEQDDAHGHFLTGRPIVFGQRTDLGWHDEIIEQAFNVQPKENTVFLPKVMSRKKQIIPMLSALWG